MEGYRKNSDRIRGSTDAHDEGEPTAIFKS
jgi:hypothetical protein